jgi:two-component system chemotaxis response regulator CheB
MDVVFLRNAVIYFKPDDTDRIISKILNILSGYLFLGHSESLPNAQASLRKVGHSIYLHQTQSLSQDLIVIGASTGGVEALKVVLEKFPLGSPPILIVQHIPENFSKAFANRLNEICQIQVSEARDKEVLERSHAYIAPGGKQMKLIKANSGLVIEINDDPPMGLHKPSVDYLFNSILPLAKERTISAALLTGMGSDGAKGLKKLRDIGVYTVAQNEETSVVFGMPGVAVELGGAVDVVPLNKIAGKLMLRHTRNKRAA